MFRTKNSKPFHTECSLYKLALSSIQPRIGSCSCLWHCTCHAYEHWQIKLKLSAWLNTRRLTTFWKFVSVIWVN